MRTRAGLLTAGLISTVVLLGAPAAQARDQNVSSFDGTQIVTHFFPAKGLASGAKAPTILVGHGWGGRGATDIDGGTTQGTAGNTAIGDLHRAGYNVLTWDARGFGGSGGTIHVDGPDFEAKDVQSLISYVANQPEAKLDRAGDPRLGMAGGSYGGGIQLVTAGLDKRVDVIVPDISWHSLVTSLYKDETIKLGWGSLLTGAGNATGRPDPRINSAFVQGAATGKIGATERAFFESRGPGPLVDKIRIPTLLTQGTVDTLFTLHEAETNYRILHGNKVPVKMMWHCGGHGTCDFPAGEPGRVENAALKWFDRYLNGNTKVDTGPAFEWIDDKGTWHTSAGYPLKPRAALSGSGSGTLPLAPALTTGSPTDAMSGSPNVEVAIPAPKGSESLVGAPELRLAYNGTASQADTRVYAQVVDKTNGQALGNQVTPIPVILDGTNRTVSRPLESIAAQAGPSSKLAVQIVPASLIYGTQRATGAVTFSSAKATLPAGEPVKATTTRLAFRKVARTRASSVRKRKRTMRFGLCASGGKVRSISVVVKRGKHVMAKSRRFNAGSCRKPKVRRFKGARKGTYTVVAAGKDAAGHKVRTTKKFRLR
jgi:ABC-2 type transport system ATP-binding protein